jgi:hypothetical protein
MLRAFIEFLDFRVADTVLYFDEFLKHKALEIIAFLIFFSTPSDHQPANDHRKLQPNGIRNSRISGAPLEKVFHPQALP